MNFNPINWKEYNKPPFLPQWLCRDETLEMARYDDGLRVDIENNLRAMADQYDLDNVRGDLLDRLGKILNEPRDANTDEFYRIILKLRILLNTTNGSINDIIKTIKFLYSSEEVHLVAAYPAGIIIEHDGEGTPGLNFNKIIAQVVPAGVDYSTKEIFRFIDEITVTDSLIITVVRNAQDSFQDGVLKYNGRGKYDGHTLNPTELIRTKYNGRNKYDGSIKYSGQQEVPATSYIRVPFKYRPGIVDDLNVTLGKHFEDIAQGKIKYNGTIKYNGAHKYSGQGPASMYDFGLFIRPGVDYADTETMSEQQEVQAVRNTDERFSTAQRYDGFFKYDGKIKYNAQRETFIVSDDTFSITDIETMAESVNIGKRYYRKYNGQYHFDGEIKYNGGIFIPV
jgi:hypothetical protein